MIKMRYATASLLSAVLFSAGSLGVVSAATTHNTSGNVGTSTIPRTVYRQDKLAAEAAVLNTTTVNIQSAHTNKDLKKLLANAGLSRQTFNEQLKIKLTTELEAQGYDQAQISIAQQQKTINHLRHHNK
ncbi:MAG: hypothetical protein ABI602_04720 [Candidatus Saccharibacteria bacterium]